MSKPKTNEVVSGSGNSIYATQAGEGPGVEGLSQEELDEIGSDSESESSEDNIKEDEPQ